MRNRNGIEIKECCASCRFKRIDHFRGRICTKHRITVKKKSLCKKWKISKGLLHAGDSGGRVKSPEYLIFLVEIRERVIEGENPCGSRTAKEIYNELYGSEFINI